MEEQSSRSGNSVRREVNPYEASNVSNMIEGVSDLRITDHVLRRFSKIRLWVYMYASALMLFVFLMIVGFLDLMDDYFKPPVFIFIVLGLLIVIFFLTSVFLYRYASKISKALRRRDERSIANLVRTHKRAWVTMSIMSLATILIVVSAVSYAYYQRNKMLREMESQYQEYEQYNR